MLKLQHNRIKLKIQTEKQLFCVNTYKYTLIYIENLADMIKYIHTHIDLLSELSDWLKRLIRITTNHLVQNKYVMTIFLKTQNGYYKTLLFL